MEESPGPGLVLRSGIITEEYVPEVGTGGADRGTDTVAGDGQGPGHGGVGHAPGPVAVQDPRSAQDQGRSPVQDLRTRK